MKINLGCGRDYREGWINVDAVPDRADVVHDLNQLPYPFGDNCADLIALRHVLEHLDRIVPVMDELWRLTKPGGRVEITVPFFASCSAMTHPEHRHAFSYGSLELVTEGSQEKYTDRMWRYVDRNFHFHSYAYRRLLFGRLTDRAMAWLADSHPTLYESTFLAYVYPARELRFVLTPLK